MSRILIVDDDPDLVEGLRWYLEAEGYEVSAAGDGEEALTVFREVQPDVVILDVMMPKMDGFETCRAMRAESDAMILMLSARDGEIDKVRALQIGADDYVTKPFHASELVARVQALLRRSRPAQPSVTSTYRWKGLEILHDERQVRVNGNPVELTTMEFDLLCTFTRRPRMVFTRDHLAEAIWGDDFYGDLRLVDNHVYRLREKLARAGMDDTGIATIRGVGYAFRPD